MSNITMNINQPSGKFLKIIHRINDGLFMMGTKKILSPLIQKNASTAPIQQAESNSETTHTLEEKINDEVKIEQLNIDSIQNDTEIEQQSLYQIDETNIIENCKLHSVETVDEKIETEPIEINQPMPVLTQEENDKSIQTIFLYLLKLYFKDHRELFPLDPGKLLKDFMKPLSIELGLPFDFKTSSYKKINNFLKSMQKDKNLITFNKPKGLQNDCILSVIFEHPIIVDLVPKIKKIKFVEKEPSDDEKENILLQKDEKIEVSQLYKPNQRIKKMFEKVDKNFDPSKYYSLKHCNEILTTYLKEKDLFLKGGMIRLDQDLKSSLFKSDKKEPCFIGIIDLNETYKMEEILLNWKQNLNEKSFITKTNSEQEQTILTNTGLKVKIYAKKLNNKNVTIIDGLQNFVNVKDAIKVFSKHFACSVTLKDFQSVKDAIFIQGYWVSELVTLLQEEIKLNKQYIQVEDKLNLKVKKK